MPCLLSDEGQATLPVLQVMPTKVGLTTNSALTTASHCYSHRLRTESALLRVCVAASWSYSSAGAALEYTAFGTPQAASSTTRFPLRAHLVSLAVCVAFFEQSHLTVATLACHAAVLFAVRGWTMPTVATAATAGAEAFGAALVVLCVSRLLRRLHHEGAVAQTPRSPLSPLQHSSDASQHVSALGPDEIKHEHQADGEMAPESEMEDDDMQTHVLAAQVERLLDFLKSRLAGAPGEAAILRCGADTCAALFPAACALGLGCFTEGTGTQAVAMLEVASRTLDGERALRSALPVNVGAPFIGGAQDSSDDHTPNNTSIARVCGATNVERPFLLDSAAFPDELAECDDWMLALDGGLESCRAVTAPLQAGAVVVGFLTLHFDDCRTCSETPYYLDKRPVMFASAMRSVCDLIAGAIFVRRAFAIAPDQDAPDSAGNAADLLLSAAERDDVGRALFHRPTSPSWRNRGASPPQAGRGSQSLLPSHLVNVANDAAPASEAATSVDEDATPPNSVTLLPHDDVGTSAGPYLRVVPDDACADEPCEADETALQELDRSSAEDDAVLLDWSFDAWSMPEASVPHLLVAILHGCGLLRRFRIPPSRALAFTTALAEHMPSNPFHNVRHVFAVTVTAYRFVHHSATCRHALEDVDVLALLLAAMCHDLEHPGTTNAFQVNTCSQLALRYNDISVLENHHAATAFALMAQTQLLANLSPADGRAVRKRVVSAILATDMGKHKELLSTVGERISAAQSLAAEEAAAATAPARTGFPSGNEGSMHNSTPRTTTFEEDDSGGPVAAQHHHHHHHHHGAGGHAIERAQSLSIDRRPPYMQPLERRSSMRRGSHLTGPALAERFAGGGPAHTHAPAQRSSSLAATSFHAGMLDRRPSDATAAMGGHAPAMFIERRGSLERMRSSAGNLSPTEDSSPPPAHRISSSPTHIGMMPDPAHVTDSLLQQRRSLSRVSADGSSLPPMPRISGSGPRRSSRSSITAAIADLGLALGPQSGNPRASCESTRSLSGAAAEYNTFLVAHVFTDSPEDRQLLVSFLLHCADLCTPLLPPSVSARVCDDLADEFAAQAARERQAGLPVTVMLAGDDQAKARMETGFIDFVVRPLYVSLCTILPDLGQCLTLIDKNRRRWDALLKAGR